LPLRAITFSQARASCWTRAFLRDLQLDQSMSDAARTAYLFQCECEDLYAVSLDITGANITRSLCTQGWVFREHFELGPRAQVPAPIMAEAILRGIADRGYYMWRGWSGSSNRPPR
jgi:hypothetical protein